MSRGTVFPAEFGLDLNSDFIRSPLSQGNTEALMTCFISVITETHGGERAGRNTNMFDGYIPIPPKP